MTKSKTPSASSLIAWSAALSVGCALALALLSAPALRAAGAPALQSLDDKAPALPLTATFTKVEGADSGPYVLKLQNTSKDALKVTAQVLTSLPSHADRRTRDIPEHEIAAGETWSIPDLAASDKVTVKAPGFAPLELTVP
jgi:hypothetical protein